MRRVVVTGVGAVSTCGADAETSWASVVAGKSGLGRRIEWTHVSELPDPGPWLEGGELLIVNGFDRLRRQQNPIDSLGISTFHLSTLSERVFIIPHKHCDLSGRSGSWHTRPHH